jgi:hypothetical protein
MRIRADGALVKPRLALVVQVNVLLAAGFVSAIALAGCGGGNTGGSSVAAKVSTAVGTRSVSAPTVGAPTVGAPTVERTVTEAQGATTVSQTQTVEQTVTAPTTVQQTVTTTPTIAPAITSAQVTTTAQSTSSGETPTWAWLLIAALGVGVVALAVVLLRRHGSAELPLEQRRQAVAAAAGSWVAQGWAIESQTDESAILQRDGQRMVLSVDARGHVTSSPLGAPPP